MKIKTYGPFSIRGNLNQQEEALNRVHGITFIADAKDNDWYSLQKQFSAESLKIVFDENGLINSASYDASSLWPQGLSVAEVKVIPDSFSLPVPGGQWVFDGKSIVAYVPSQQELLAAAEARRTALMAEATMKIAPLQDAADLQIATDNEKALLTALKRYRVDLNRIDISFAPDIKLPEVPRCGVNLLLR